jgi:hypothetical protein
MCGQKLLLATCSWSESDVFFLLTLCKLHYVPVVQLQLEVGMILSLHLSSLENSQSAISSSVLKNHASACDSFMQLCGDLKLS